MNINTLNISLIKKFSESNSSVIASFLDFQNAFEVSKLLNDLSPKITVDILERMLPQKAASIILNLSESHIDKILDIIQIHNLLSILQFLNKEDKKAILEKVKYLKKINLEFYLNYRLDLVGSWMQTDIPQVNVNFSISDVKNYLKENFQNKNFKEVYVLDNNEFKGIISLDKLILSDNKLTCDSIYEQFKHTISPKMKLKAISNNPGFNKYERLPVVENKNQLLGSLAFIDLQKGLQHNQAVNSPTNDNDTLMYGVYGQTLLNLLNIKE